MDAVFGFLTVVGGIIYVCYQIHNDSPGELSSSIISYFKMMLIFSPAFGFMICSLSLDAIYYNEKMICTVLCVIFLLLAFLVLGGVIDPFRSQQEKDLDKAVREKMRQSRQITEMLRKMPEPTLDELEAYRKKLGKGYEITSYSTLRTKFTMDRIAEIQERMRFDDPIEEYRKKYVLNKPKDE